MKRIGRPTVRTLPRAKIICNAIGRGLPFTHACAVARISFETFSRWRSSDEKFRAQIDEATAKGVDRRLKVIERATNSQDEAIRLRAACWFLEHTQPQHFARNRIEISGADGSPLAVGIGIYLPQKDGDANGTPVVTVDTVKEVENES